jgi:hypothetical protein
MIAGWIGWLAVGIIVAVTVIYAIKFHRGKRTDSDLIGPIPKDGFAYCHYPKDLGTARGEILLELLQEVRDQVWSKCAESYGHVLTEKWIVSKLTVKHGEVDPEHLDVRWKFGAQQIILRIQDTMYFHFAGEVHNVYRHMMYGPLWVGKTKSGRDRRCLVNVQEWIAQTFNKDG